MDEEQKRIKALIDEQIQLLKDNPKLKGKTDAKLWGNELRSRASKAYMADPEYRKIWDKKLKDKLEPMYRDPNWQKNVTLANQLKAKDPEWIKNNKQGVEKRCNSPTWRENQKLAAQEARSKTISCNGIIYKSRIDAALNLAPDTVTTNDSKAKWLAKQMKKYPESYFYVDEHGNQVTETKVEVDPKTIDPTYMTLEERKALAKMKREQDDITK